MSLNSRIIQAKPKLQRTSTNTHADSLNSFWQRSATASLGGGTFLNVGLDDFNFRAADRTHWPSSPAACAKLPAEIRLPSGV